MKPRGDGGAADGTNAGAAGELRRHCFFWGPQAPKGRGAVSICGSAARVRPAPTTRSSEAAASTPAGAEGAWGAAQRGAGAEPLAGVEGAAPLGMDG
jgi:hypothetical protein